MIWLSCKVRDIIKKAIPIRVKNCLVTMWNCLYYLIAYKTTVTIEGIDYDEYWEVKAGSRMGQLSSFRLARARAIANVIEEGSSVLDIGCGDGAILKYLIAEKGVAAQGIDISEKAVTFARSEGLNVSLGDVLNSDNLDMSSKYDYIILSEIIEHIPDPEKLLLQLRDKFNKALIISIPNTGWIEHRVRLLLGRFPLQWICYPGEHLRFWTLKDFQWWVDLLGYNINAVIPYQGFPVLKNICPNLFAQAFVFVVTKGTSSCGEG